MSSPGGMPLGGPLWQAMHPQAPPMVNETQGEDGVSIRPMRLKVLYTFDDQNKTNCLARWPHVMSIQTINLDETTIIGVVELQTCIKAVVECSPELIPRMDRDYTVYAYDYSEYDNPLVGQGMLSKALAAVSPTPGAPASQSRQLITGRVCKNILGLFTNGVKETLEVKLRLVPVPKAVQGDYFSAMEKYREMSKAVTPGADLAEWASFLQSNSIGTPQTSHHAIAQQKQGRSMEVVNQLLSPSPILSQQPVPEQITQPTHHYQPGPPVQIVNGDTTQGTASSGKAARAGRGTSKAATKRPRVKKQPRNPAPSGGNTSGYEEGTDADDGPLPKKRAKITQADWNSKSAFGSGCDSLRVTASTAGSLRLFRPIASGGGPNAANHLQEIPRVPTPIPTFGHLEPCQQQGNARSGLRRPSVVSEVNALPKHSSPYLQTKTPAGKDGQIRPSIESPDRSPERIGSPGDTPQGIRSSPPVMRDSTLMRSSPPCPSSPDLPSMPRADSGFLSTSLDDLFGDDDDMIRPVHDEDLHIASRNAKRCVANERREPADRIQGGLTIEEECPGPPELLPTRMPVKPPKVTKAASKLSRSRATSVTSDDGQALPPLKKSRGKSKLASPAPSQIDQHPPMEQQSQVWTQNHIPCVTHNFPAADLVSGRPSIQQDKASTSQPPSLPLSMNSPQSTSETSESRMESRSRHLIRTASLGSLSLPTPAPSDPTAAPPTLQRAMTYTELAFVTNDSDPAQFSTSEPTYSRTAQAKRDANQRRLELALKNGEMPTFCENCGAIETPTWRKAWAQEIQGPPGYYEYSDEPGKVTMVVIMNRGADGAPTSHLIIKKFLLPKESAADYKEYYLCNPCGIWMSKYKSHRPEDRWGSRSYSKPALPKKRPTQRAAKPKKARTLDSAHPTSEANYPQSEPNFSQGMHQNTSEIAQCDGASPVEAGDAGAQGRQARAVRSRQGSERPIKRSHPLTSDAASAALKRAIQSSPAVRWGSQHSPIDVEDRPDLGSTRRLLFPSPRKDGSAKVLGEVTTNVVHITSNVRSLKDALVDMPDKENCPPAIEEDEADAELARLFEEELSHPTTPIQKTPSELPFKTPPRPASNHRPVTRSVTRSNKSKAHFSPHRTPSKTPTSWARRRSPRYQDQVFESPFTASLNQLMSDANNFSPTRNDSSLDIDFGTLPDLPFDHNTHSDLNFQLAYDNDDFFSTDIHMPSSPPRPFRLYEDPLTNMDSVDWNDFAAFDMNGGKSDDVPKEVQVKQEPEDDDCHPETGESQEKDRAE